MTTSSHYQQLIAILSIGVFGLIQTSRVAAQPVLWDANGHYYEVVNVPRVTWSEANLLAKALTFEGRQGHLVTITSAAEQDFLINTFQLGGNQRFYLGGFQDTGSPEYAEPDGAWSWVTGEEFSYENWNESTFAGDNQPNNAFNLPENFLATYGPPGATGQWTWNDLPNDPSQGLASNEFPIGYVVEYEAIPEPLSISIALASVPAFVGLGRAAEGPLHRTIR